MASPSLWSRLAAAFRPAPTATREVYTGAQVNRLTYDWIRAPLSADRELQNDFTRLRGRGRDLTKNNPYARRFLRAARAHVIGPKGIQLHPCVEFATGEPYSTVNEAIEDAWKDFCRPQHASASGRLSFLALCRLAVSEWVAAGESLTIIRYSARYKYGMALQPVDPDRLDETYWRAADPRRGLNEIRNGIEFDDAGAPVTYYILDTHPADIGSSFGREQARRPVPASQVIHLFLNDERVDQSRGVTPLASAMRDLRHLDGFQEAALVQARTAAASMGFITTKGDGADVTEPTEGLEFAAEAGVIRELGLGQEFQSWDPNQPSETYGGFVKAILRGIAAGMGTSYATLANDLSDANYSSMRVGRAEEQETWQELQGWFIDQFCEPVYAAWFASAVLANALPVTLAGTRDYTAHRWIPRRWASVDPVKDIEADERRVALGVASRQNIAARDGDDLWDVLEDLAEEQAYADSLGVNIEPPRKAAGGTPNGDAQGAAGNAPGNGDGAGRGGDGDAGGRRRPSTHLAVVRRAGGAMVRP